MRGLSRVYKSIERKKSIAMISLAILLAQTITVDVDQAARITEGIAKALLPIVAVIILVGLPILVFRILASEVLETVRGR